MFCLVTDLMDWEDYPAPELAALYRWRWDGSETALREAKAPLRGAGPAPGRCSAPAPRTWSGRSSPPGPPTGMPAARLDGALRRRNWPPRSLSGPVLSLSPRFAVVYAIRSVTPAPGRDQRDRAIPERRRPRPAPRPQVQVPVVLRARDREGHRHPHRPRHHHHGQHPSLTSGNTVNLPEREPCRTVDPAAAGTTRRPPACPPEGNYPQ